MRAIMIKKRILFSLLAFFMLGIAWCCSTMALNTPVKTRVGLPPATLNSRVTAAEQAYKINGINPDILQLAFKAYNNAKSAGHGAKDLFTIVDYSLPSTMPRLWVIDMQTKQIIFNTHVAHGLGSGNNYATQFSNTHGSRMSSLGMFLTADVYAGNYGHSLNLIGLEKNFNSNAFARRIVFHKAHYVDDAIIKKIGRLGRSFGCLALNKKIADKVISTIKGGSLVFCYYPDQKWLKESSLLNS